MKPAANSEQMRAMIRIANGQGFWGDSLEAPLEQMRRGPLDYLTLDYLAEVTMSILQKQRSRDPRAGYARDFVEMIGRGAVDIASTGIKIVANAGGVNPEACRDAVAKALNRRGTRIGVVAGDNILDRLDDLIARGVELKNWTPASRWRPFVRACRAPMSTSAAKQSRTLWPRARKS